MLKLNRFKSGLIALLFASLVVLTTCQSLSSVFQDPILTLHSVELTKINFTGVDILCRVNVENRSPIDIPFPDIDWELFINANSFISGNINAGSSIRARQSTIVNVPVKLDFLEIFNTFVSLKGNKRANYKVALGAKFNLPIIRDRVWRFEHEGDFPLLKLPSISFNGIHLKNISLTRVDFQLVWEIENNNDFAMNLNDLSFNLTVNNAQWASGKVPGAPQISPEKKTLVPLDFSISTLSMVAEISDIIARGTDITYACGGNLNLGAALPGLDDYNAPFNFSGTTKLSR